MRICFAICGLPRCIDLVINRIDDLFSLHDISYYICLTNNYKNYEKEYNNTFDITNIINNKNISKILFIKDLENSLYRNSLNYTNKIKNILSTINDNYDMYILIRSDFIFNSIDFLENIKDINKIYLSNNNNINKYICDENYRYNDNIIITKNHNNFINLYVLYELAKQNNNYLEIILYNYINTYNIDYSQIEINYKLVLSKCNIIAIAGDSGSGKSTLLNELSKLFSTDNYLKLETDRYHKWERGSLNYLEYSHLNPKANNLDKMQNDVYNLKTSELKYTQGIIFWVTMFFFMGAAFGYFMLAPFTFNFLSNYTIGNIGVIDYRPTLADYLDSLIDITLGAGVAFELPMATWLLSKLGIITPDFLRTYRKYAYIALLVVAAIITPSPDWGSQLIVVVPLVLLYEISILIAARVKKKQDKDWE